MDLNMCEIIIQEIFKKCVFTFCYGCLCDIIKILKKI